jgi:hypothetical protein
LGRLGPRLRARGGNEPSRLPVGARASDAPRTDVSGQAAPSPARGRGRGGGCDWEGEEGAGTGWARTEGRGRSKQGRSEGAGAREGRRKGRAVGASWRRNGREELVRGEGTAGAHGAPGAVIPAGQEQRAACTSESGAVPAGGGACRRRSPPPVPHPATLPGEVGPRPLSPVFRRSRADVPGERPAPLSLRRVPWSPQCSSRPR